MLKSRFCVFHILHHTQIYTHQTISNTLMSCRQRQCHPGRVEPTKDKRIRLSSYSRLSIGVIDSVKGCVCTPLCDWKQVGLVPTSIRPRMNNQKQKINKWGGFLTIPPVKKMTEEEAKNHNKDFKMTVQLYHYACLKN